VRARYAGARGLACPREVRYLRRVSVGASPGAVHGRDGWWIRHGPLELEVQGPVLTLARTTLEERRRVVDVAAWPESAGAVRALVGE